MRKIVTAGVLLPVLLSLTTCDLFKVGLGEKVDISAPEISITSPANGAYISGDKAVTGTASDDIEVKSVTAAITFDASSGIAAISRTAAFSSGSWSFDLDSSSIAAGKECNATVIVTATDSSGKTAQQKIIVYIDNNPPKISLSIPASSDLDSEHYFPVNGSVNFEGSVDKDVASLELEAGGRTWKPAAITAYFDIQVDTEVFKEGDSGVQKKADGRFLVPYTLYAYDSAGNKSVESKGSMLVDQTLDKPTLSFDSADSPLSFKRGTSVSGIIADDDALDEKSLSFTLTNAKTNEPTVFSGSASDSKYAVVFSSRTRGREKRNENLAVKEAFSFTVPIDLAQGEYSLDYSLSDLASAKIAPLASSGLHEPKANTAGKDKIIFYVNDGEPMASIAQPSDGQVVRKLNASGSAEDGIGLAGIEHQIIPLGGTLADGGWTAITDGSGNNPFSWTIPEITKSDGDYILYVRAASLSGAKTKSPPYVKFTIDTMAPTISIASACPDYSGDSLSPSPVAFAVVGSGDAAYSYVNGWVRVSGSAADKSLASVSWSLTDKQSGNVVIPETPVPPSDILSWKAEIDTNGLTDGASYVFTARAVDQAGNSKSASRELRVRQSDDRPTVSLGNMFATATDKLSGKSNLLTTNPRLTATVYDDDWVDSSSVKIQFDGEGEWQPVEVAPQGDGSATFTFYLSSLKEGPHSFSIRALDSEHGAEGRKNGQKPVTGDSTPVWFVIDTVQPQVTVDSSKTSYDGIHKTMHLEGTVSTANELDDKEPLTLSWKGGSGLPSLGAKGSDGNDNNVWSWSYSLDVSSNPPSDGEFSLTATAKDEYGLPGPKPFTVTVDRTPPVIGITNGDQVMSDLHGFVLNGHAADATTGVASMTAKILDSGNVDHFTPAMLTLDSNAATAGSTGGAWSLNLKGLSGVYGVTISAVDKVGNTTTSSPVQIIVDTDSPDLTVDSLLVDGAVFNAKSAIPANWTGSASDDFLESVSLKSADWAASFSVPSSGTTRAWSYPSGWSSLSEGQHAIALTAVDKGGHSVTKSVTFTKDTAAPSNSYLNIAEDENTVLNEKTSSLSGTVRDAVTGIQSLSVYVDSVEYRQTVKAGDNSFTWSVPIGGLASGQHSVWVVTADVAGNAYSGEATPTPFRVDTDTPQLSISTPIDGKIYGAGVFGAPAGTATGLSSDSFISSVYAQLDGGTQTNITPASGATWSFDTKWSSLADGPHTLIVTASDLGGHSKTASLSFTKDTTAPTIAISAPSLLDVATGKAIAQNGVVKLAGSIKDSYASTAVYFIFSSSDTWTASVDHSAPEWSNGTSVEKDKLYKVTKATNGTSPTTVVPSPDGTSLSFDNERIDTSKLTETSGNYYLYVLSEDGVGNVGSSGPQLFKVDQSQDLPTVTAIGLDARMKRGTTITLTVGDDDGWILPAKISVLVDSAAATVSGGTNSLSGGRYLSSYSFRMPDDLTEGPHTIQVSASDEGLEKYGASAATGLLGASPYAFGIDVTPPSLSVLLNGSDTNGVTSLWVNGPFTLSGLAEDKLNLVAKVTVVIDSDSADMIPALSDKSYSWSHKVETTLSNGSHTVAVIALDDFGNAQRKEYTLNVDSTLPTATIATPASGGYVSGSAATLSGTASDSGGSQLAKVQYKLTGPTAGDSVDWTDANGKDSWSVVFDSTKKSEGSYTLSVRAYDNAGNHTDADVTRSFFVDQAPPVLAVTTAASDKPYRTAFPLSGTAKDPADTSVPGANNGIASVTLSLDDASFNAEHVGSVSADLSASSDWSYDLSTAPAGFFSGLSGKPESFSSIPDGNHTLYIRARDKAGRTTESSYTFIKDGTVPTASAVAVTTLLSGNLVNGMIKLSGTAADNMSLDRVELSIKGTKPDGSEYSDLLKYADTQASSWTSTDFDTAALFKDGTTVTLVATAYDKAGNSAASAPLEIIVEQSTDIPLISLINISADPKTPTTLLNSSKVYGSLSDDDGAVSSFAISENGSDGWKAVTPDGSGNWSYPASSGDGAKKLYFKVKDAKGAEYSTTDDAKLDSMTSPRVKNGAAYVNTPISFSVDTIAPEVPSASVYVNTVDAAPADFDKNDRLLATGDSFGGSKTGKFLVQVQAKSANDIGSVSIGIKGKKKGTSTDMELTQAASYISTDSVTGYQYWVTSAPLDVMGLSDATLTMEISVTDKPGLSTKVSKSIIVDNTAPVISFFTPANREVVTGTVTVKGWAEEATGLTAVRYKVGLDSSSQAWKAVTGSLVNWQLPQLNMNDYAGQAISTISDGTFTMASAHGLSAGDIVYFDAPSPGAMPSGLSPSSAYYVVQEGLAEKTFKVSATSDGGAIAASGGSAVSVSKKSSDKNNDGVWDLPVTIQAEDKAGNVRETALADYTLAVDPGGDKPKVTILYPSDPTQPMGGTIRVYGSATDNNSVFAVYMQIDADRDGQYDATDIANGKDWYNGGNGQPVDGSFNWNLAINGDGEFNPKTVNATALKAGVSYVILSVGTTDYMADFGAASNAAGTRFTASRDGASGDGSGTVTSDTIKLRVRAQDTKDGKTGGIYGSWQELSVIVSTSVPKIGSTTPLRLENAVTGAMIPYTPGMYLPDVQENGVDWYLEGSIEDSAGISSATLEATEGDLTCSLKNNPTYFPAISGGYGMKVPITVNKNESRTLASNLTVVNGAKPQASAMASFLIKIDSKAPTSLGFTGQTPIVQSNRLYKLVGAVADDGSGVSKVEVYFVRKDLGNSASATGKFYKPHPDYFSGRFDDVAPCAVTDKGALPTATFSYNSASDSVYPANPAYLITIRESNTVMSRDSASHAILNGDSGDGGLYYVKNCTPGSSNQYDWSIDIDSLSIPDGPLEIHYVVYDLAGNSSHYRVATKVQNNGPSMSAIKLGTDLNQYNGVEESEKTSYATLDASTDATSFTVKQEPMTFDLGVSGGNGDLYYYLTETASGFAKTGTLRSSGALGTITLTDSDLKAIDDRSPASFLITVWDSTDETVSGGGAYSTHTSLEVQKTISCVIHRKDTMNPISVISPFYWNSASDNSLYGNSTANGHIELKGVFTPSQPDLSGKVTIRGTSFDDQRIKNIWMQMDNFAFAGSSENKTINKASYSKMATFNAGSFTSEGDFENKGWKFTVDSSVFDQAGHRVVWHLDLDTSKIDGVAGKGLSIRSAVEDKADLTSPASPYADTNSLSGSASRPDSMHLSAAALKDKASFWPGFDISVGGTRTTISAYDPETGTITLATPIDTSLLSYSIRTAQNVVPVDVVPYITGITNDSGKGLDNGVLRSSTGKYSMDASASESFNVTGFNLGGTDSAPLEDAPKAYISAAAISETSTSYQQPVATFVSSSSITVKKTMATLRSGYLTVFVHGVASINNLDDDEAGLGGRYNKETSAARPDSTLWNDDRYLWFWEDTTVAANEDSAGDPVSGQTYYYPSMLMASGQPVFAYCNNNDGYTWRTTNDTVTDKRVGKWFARNAAMALTSDGQYIIASNEDNFTGSSAGYLHVDLADTNTSAAISSSYASGTGVIELCGVEWDGTVNGGVSESRQLNRFMYPNLIASGASGSAEIYVSYFDAHPSRQQIQFFAFKWKNTTDWRGNTVIGSNLTEPNDDYKIAGNGNVTVPNTKGASSQYTAMDLVVDGSKTTVLIAYYDPSTGSLKLAYNATPTLSTGLADTTAANWHSVTIDSASQCGANVSMTHDSTYVYVAYCDSANANLKLAVLKASDLSVVSTKVIDSYQSVGAWTNIQLVNGHPYISYYNNSYNGTKSSIKIAYPIAANGRSAEENTLQDGATASSDAFTGNWEVMSVPTLSAPQGGKEEFTRTMLGSYSSGALPVVAWLGNPKLEYAKLQPDK